MPTPTVDNVPRPAAAGYGARIGDYLFRLGAGPGRELRVQSAPPQAQRIQTSEVAEEFVDEFGQVFARSDFTGGENLQYAHDRDNPPDAAARYWDSSGIDVREPAPGEDRVIRLLHTTALIEAVVGTVRMAVTGAGVLYATDGTTTAKSSNPTDAVPVFAADDPHAGEGAVAVNDLAALGSDIYAALGANGIHCDTGAGWAHWSALAAVRVWGAKNRIVASTGDTIAELSGAGVATTLKTIDPDRAFTAVIDGGSAILAGADDGYVYAFTPTGTAGALELAGQDLFQDEQVVSLAYAQGLIFVGTAEPVAAGGVIGRLWRCELTGATLTNRVTVRQWGDASSTLDHAPYGLLGGRDAVIAGVREAAGTMHTWRHDLANAGVQRWLEFAEGDECRMLLSIEGLLFAGIDTGGVFRQTGTFVDEGWLIGPLGDFFSATEKTWIGARMDADVESGQQVVLSYATETSAIDDESSTDWRPVRTDSGGGLADETPMTGVQSRWIAGLLRLTPSDDNTSPSVRSFSFRAFPSDYDVLVQIPVNCSDRLERHNRRGQVRRGRGQDVFATLRTLEGQSVICEVYPLDLIVRGQVVQIDAPVAAVTERGSQTFVALATIRGKESSTAGLSATDGVLGGAVLGGAVMGGS